MKKLLFLILVLFTFVMQAQQVIDLSTGLLTPASSLPKPEKIVEENDNSIVVNYKFTYALIEQDSVYPDNVIISLPGFNNETRDGFPCVSRGMDSFFVPLNSNPQMSVLSSSYIELEYDIASARKPMSLTNTEPYAKSNVFPIIAYSGFWPNSICEPLPIGRHRHQHIARVEINPIQYNMESKKVRILTNLKYKITYVPITDEITENECCDYIINPNFASAQLKRFNLDREMGWSQRANAGYAIFSVPEFESALKDFIDWKQRLGYNVKAFYDANWDSTKISNKITSLYWKDEARTEIDTDFNLSYLLFVGNDSLVPSGRVSYKWNKEEISDQFFLTDLPYGCMDGVGDLYPDIYRGRWPVYFESEVETIVDKVIRYEHRPPYDSDFYTSGTHFAFFEDGSKVGVNDGVEDGRFVKTSEDLFNYLTNNYDYTIDRIYTIDTTKTNNKDGLRYWPKEWSRYYSEGGDVPADMLYENGFNWQHTNHDLNKSINKGPSYLFVSGHGSENTWAWGTNRWYASYDVKWLKNRERIPVIFSISCLTGKFNDYRCLMRQFLSNPNGGAIGAFASSHVTYYNQFAALTQYFTNAIWPVPGIRLYENNRIQVNESAFESPHSIQQLGVILDHAVYNLPSVSYGTSNFTRNTFHCYGDPSLYFRTQEPITFDSSTEEVNRTAFGINAYLHDVEGFICFYDPTTGKSQRFYGTEASFVPEYSNVVKYIDVTVYTPNSVPYTDFGEFYPGYIGPDVSGTRLLGFRGNLDGSTATIDYYISMADKGKRLEILIVDMSTGNIISSWPLNEETTEFGQKCSVGIYCHSGLMTASLMVDGYPVSNIKVQIKL